MAQQLKERIAKRQQECQGQQGWDLLSSFLPWLLPTLGPIITIGIIVMIIPCALMLIKDRIQEATRVAVNQMLLHPYIPVPVEPQETPSGP